MARWSLRNAHYLNVPGTEYEQKETNRDTGKQARKVYYVPLLLDPNNPADHNYPSEGMIIVCHEGKGYPRDIAFLGKPTPDMEALDDEAKAISADEEKNWIHPIESLDGTYGESLIKQFEMSMAEMLRKQGGAVSQQQSPDVAALLAQVKALSEQVALLSAQAVPAKEEPLEEVEPTAEELAAAEEEAAKPARRRA